MSFEKEVIREIVKHFDQLGEKTPVIPVLVTSFDLNRQELVVFNSEKAKPQGELTQRQLPSGDIALATQLLQLFPHWND